MVSIVMLSHNRSDALQKNLPRLHSLAQEHGCELILVDNASIDGSVALIQNTAISLPHAKVVLNVENLGVAGGRNAGWRLATREFILNIDDDTIVSSEAVEAMLAVLRARDDVGIVSPRILHAKTREAQLDYGSIECQISNFHGCCHMVRSSLVRKIGYNDEACSFGGEELDYSIRARTVGMDVIYTPVATVFHDNFTRPPSEGKQRRERWAYNFIRIHHKHFGPRRAFVFSARYLLSLAISGVRVFGLGFIPVLFSAAVRGVCDGRRNRAPVPRAVENFYARPDLRPDLGNIPIWSKLVGRFTARRSIHPHPG